MYNLYQTRQEPVMVRDHENEYGILCKNKTSSKLIAIF